MSMTMSLSSVKVRLVTSRIAWSITVYIIHKYHNSSSSVLQSSFFMLVIQFYIPPAPRQARLQSAIKALNVPLIAPVGSHRFRSFQIHFQHLTLSSSIDFSDVFFQPWNSTVISVLDSGDVLYLSSCPTNTSATKACVSQCITLYSESINRF